MGGFFFGQAGLQLVELLLQPSSLLRIEITAHGKQWEHYIDLATTVSTEKDWVDIAKKHLEKLRRGEKSN